MASGAPYGNRTRVFAVKGRRPGPLDEGRWRWACGSIIGLDRDGNGRVAVFRAPDAKMRGRHPCAGTSGAQMPHDPAGGGGWGGTTDSRGRGRGDRRLFRGAARRDRARRDLPGASGAGRETRCRGPAGEKSGRRRAHRVAENRDGGETERAVRPRDPSARPTTSTAPCRPASGGGAQTAVLPILNGMRHLDVLDAAFGPERVLGGHLRHRGDADQGGRDPPDERIAQPHLRRARRHPLGAHRGDRGADGGRALPGRSSDKVPWRCGRSGCFWRRWPARPR